MPNAAFLGDCAFCETELLRHAPVLAHLIANDGEYELRTGSRVLAYAETVGEVLRVKTVGGRIHTLVRLEEERGLELVLFDTELNVVASMHETNSASRATLMSGADDRTTAIVRADGAGGLHASGPCGNVLMFAGRSRSNPSGLELLITDAGVARPLVSLFALLVAMEDAELGPLHSPVHPGEAND